MKLLLISAIAILVVLTHSSCKKKTQFKEENAQDAVDVQAAMAAIDEVVLDVNTLIADEFLLRGKDSDSLGREAARSAPCGMVVDTTQLLNGVLSVSYTNVPCKTRTRSGGLKVVLQEYPIKKWKSLSCIAEISLINYKVLQNRDGVSITLNGNLQMQNQTGGTWYDLWYLSEPKVIYDISVQDLELNFGGLNSVKFQVKRRLTFTYENQITNCQVVGIGSDKGISDLQCWGQNRLGEGLSCKVMSPIKWDTKCGPWAPISGKTELTNDKKKHILTTNFGVNAEGLEQEPGQCAFGYLVKWTYKRDSNSRIFQFY